MNTMHIEVSRGRSIWVFALALAAAALVGWFAWELSNPDFSAGGYRKAAFLEGMPIWLRVGFFGFCTLACLYGAAVSLQAALRKGPSFAIGPQGVSDLRKSPPRQFGWPEIGEVSGDANFLYLKRKGAGALSRFGIGRIAIPLVGVTPGRDAILSAVSAHLDTR